MHLARGDPVLLTYLYAASDFTHVYMYRRQGTTRVGAPTSRCARRAVRSSRAGVGARRGAMSFDADEISKMTGLSSNAIKAVVDQSRPSVSEMHAAIDQFISDGSGLLKEARESSGFTEIGSRKAKKGEDDGAGAKQGEEGRPEPTRRNPNRGSGQPRGRGGEESRGHVGRGRGRGREPPHRGDGERVRADSAPGAAPGGKVSPSVVQGTGHHASGSGALGATRLPPGVRMQRVHNLPPLPPSFLSLPSPSSPPLSFRTPAPCSRVAAPHRGRPHARQRPPSPPLPPSTHHPPLLSAPLLPLLPHSPTRAVSRQNPRWPSPRRNLL